MGNRTLAIIKPDAVADGHTGKIIDHIIKAGFKIKAMKMIHNLSSLKSPLERVGPLPDDWDPCYERPKQ